MKRTRVKLGMTVDVTKCELEPLHHFGDHIKGYMGCLWCKIGDKCLKFNPTKGRSLIWQKEKRY